MLVSSALPSEVYEKLPWYDTPTVNVPLFLFGALALVLAAVGLPLAFVLRRTRQVGSSRAARFAALSAWLSGVAATAFLVGFVLVMSDSNAMSAALSLSSWDFAILPVLATISAAFAAPTLPFAVVAWRARWWRPAGRIAYTMIALGSIAFVAVAHRYNLLVC